MSQMANWFREKLGFRPRIDVTNRLVKLTIAYDGGDSVLEIICPWGVLKPLVWDAEEKIGEVLREHVGEFMSILEVVEV